MKNLTVSLELAKQIEPYLIEKSDQVKRISGLQYSESGRMIKSSIPDLATIQPSRKQPAGLYDVKNIAKKQSFEMTPKEFERYGEYLQQQQRLMGSKGAFGQAGATSDTAISKAYKASDELARIKYGLGHKKNVENAIKEGKTVSDEILSLYPDLRVAQQPRKSWRFYQTAYLQDV